MGFPAGSEVKNLPVSAGDTGDMGSIPGSGRSSGNGNLLQCCCLGNSMDRGAKWASLWGHKELKTMEQLSTGKNTSCFRRTQRCSDA